MTEYVSSALLAANRERPDLVKKAAVCLAEIEATAPEFVAEVLSDFDEIGKYVYEKTANATSVADQVYKGLKIVGKGTAATILVGVGGAIANDLYDAAKRGLTKTRNYNRMLEVMKHDPELNAFDSHSDKKVRMAFNTVHRFSPEITADPFATASAVKNLASAPGMAMDSTINLISARKALVDSKNKNFNPSHGFSVIESMSKDEEAIADRAHRKEQQKTWRAQRNRSNN